MPHICEICYLQESFVGIRQYAQKRSGGVSSVQRPVAKNHPKRKYKFPDQDQIICDMNRCLAQDPYKCTVHDNEYNFKLKTTEPPRNMCLNNDGFSTW